MKLDWMIDISSWYKAFLEPAEFRKDVAAFAEGIRKKYRKENGSLRQ